MNNNIDNLNINKNINKIPITMDKEQLYQTFILFHKYIMSTINKNTNISNQTSKPNDSNFIKPKDINKERDIDKGINKDKNKINILPEKNSLKLNDENLFENKLIKEEKNESLELGLLEKKIMFLKN